MSATRATRPRTEQTAMAIFAPWDKPLDEVVVLVVPADELES